MLNLVAIKYKYRLSPKGVSNSAYDVLKMTDMERTQYILNNSDLSIDEVQEYLDINYAFDTNVGDTFRSEGIIEANKDITIPRSKDYLNSKGRIDYSVVPPDGYAIDATTGKLLKDEIKENLIGVNGVYDRYGSEFGSYMSPVGGTPTTFEQRALATVQDETTHHYYEEIGNLADIEGDINKAPLTTARKAELLTKLRDNGSITYEGKIAPGYNQIGGGIQTQTPLTIKELIEIGTLRKIR